MVLLPLLYPEIFERFHFSPPRGVLFYGPPGTHARTIPMSTLWPIDELVTRCALPLSVRIVCGSMSVCPTLCAPRPPLSDGSRTGTGKTLVARALANACTADGHRVAFFMRKVRRPHGTMRLATADTPSSSPPPPEFLLRCPWLLHVATNFAAAGSSSLLLLHVVEPLHL